MIRTEPVSSSGFSASQSENGPITTTSRARGYWCAQACRIRGFANPRQSSFPAASRWESAIEDLGGIVRFITVRDGPEVARRIGFGIFDRADSDSSSRSGFDPFGEARCPMAQVDLQVVGDCIPGRFGRQSRPCDPSLARVRKRDRNRRWPSQRIEPMTRSAVTLLFHSNTSGALLVMAHPDRWAKTSAFPSVDGAGIFQA